jgi:NarL family two-component system response regulator LiaR
MIVDDHLVVRQALAFALKTYDELSLVAQAQDGCEAVRLCAEAQPDVILMDLMMPGMDGVSTIQAIQAHYPSIKFIALSSLGSDTPLAVAAEKAGAVYLHKHTSVSVLVDTIRNLAVGQTQ